MPSTPNDRTNTRKKKRHAKGEGSLYLRGKIWWYKAPDGTCHSTGKRIQSEAVDWKLNFLTTLRQAHNGKPTTRPGIDCNEILNDYIADLELRRRRIDNSVYVINANLRPTFGARRVDSLVTADFLKYREVREKEVLPTTVNRELEILRAALNVGKKQGPPPKVISVPHFPMADESGNVRMGFLDVRGYRKVLAELPSSLKPLFVCAYHVSSRKGELVNLLWDQIDWTENVIILGHADTKNGTGRCLPIYGEMKSWLRKQQEIGNAFSTCPWVFFWHTEDCILGHGGNRCLPGSHIAEFRKSWTSAVKRAGYSNLLFHDLRRSATRNMRKAGIPQVVRMKIGGHKTASMEQRYNIVDIEDVKEAGKTMDDWMSNQDCT